jgi:hypothetical protein
VAHGEYSTAIINMEEPLAILVYQLFAMFYASITLPPALGYGRFFDGLCVLCLL